MIVQRYCGIWLRLISIWVSLGNIVCNSLSRSLPWESLTGRNAASIRCWIRYEAIQAGALESAICVHTFCTGKVTYTWYFWTFVNVWRIESQENLSSDLKRQWNYSFSSLSFKINSPHYMSLLLPLYTCSDFECTMSYDLIRFEKHNLTDNISFLHKLVIWRAMVL